MKNVSLRSNRIILTIFIVLISSFVNGQVRIKEKIELERIHRTNKLMKTYSSIKLAVNWDKPEYELFVGYVDPISNSVMGSDYITGGYNEIILHCGYSPCTVRCISLNTGLV